MHNAHSIYFRSYVVSFSPFACTLVAVIDSLMHYDRTDLGEYSKSGGRPKAIDPRWPGAVVGGVREEKTTWSGVRAEQAKACPGSASAQSRRATLRQFPLAGAGPCVAAARVQQRGRRATARLRQTQQRQWERRQCGYEGRQAWLSSGIVGNEIRVHAVEKRTSLKTVTVTAQANLDCRFRRT